MKEKIKSILANLGFTNKFNELCDAFKESEAQCSFKSNDLKPIVDKYFDNFSAYPKENLFTMTSKVHDINIKFNLTYKYGYIECSFAFWNDELTEKARWNFHQLTFLEKGEEIPAFGTRYPVVKNLQDFEIICAKIGTMYNQFLLLFKEKEGIA